MMKETPVHETNQPGLLKAGLTQGDPNEKFAISVPALY
jgi:hypothetical protein